MDKQTLDERIWPLRLSLLRVAGGKRIPLARVHETEHEPARFYTQAGDEMQLAPGRTYVALFCDDAAASAR